MSKIIRAKEDMPYINGLRGEITRNVKNMKVEKLSKFLENPLVDDMCKYMCLKSNQRAYMFSETSAVDSALQAFFESEYTQKRLASESYYNDIGEKFKESWVSEEPLGLVNKGGKLIPSYEMVIEFCALPFWEGVRILDMPFKVSNIYLVA